MRERVFGRELYEDVTRINLTSRCRHAKSGPTKAERPCLRRAVGCLAGSTYGTIVVPSVEIASPVETTPTAMMQSPAAAVPCAVDEFHRFA